MSNYLETEHLWNGILNHTAGIHLSRHFGVVEFWSRSEPFRSSQRYIGAIDYVYQDGMNDIYVRGWVFSLTNDIWELQISINKNWNLVYGYGLDRRDVFAQFPFIPHSQCSGFVFYCPGATQSDALTKELKVDFQVRANPSSETLHYGSFSMVEVQQEVTHTLSEAP